MTSRNGNHRRPKREIDLRAHRMGDYDGRYGEASPAADSASETAIEIEALRSSTSDELVAAEAGTRKLFGNASSGI